MFIQIALQTGDPDTCKSLYRITADNAPFLQPRAIRRSPFMGPYRTTTLLLLLPPLGRRNLDPPLLNQQGRLLRKARLSRYPSRYMKCHTLTTTATTTAANVIRDYGHRPPR